MKFNRYKRKLSRLLVILVFLCIFYYIIKLRRNFEPALSYDEEKQKFFINIKRISIESKSIQSSSDFYELDQIENVKVPFQIKSCHVYYTKLPIWQWQSVIESAKNLGLNTIEIEIPWNAHETIHGVYDFDSMQSDLQTFIKLVYLNNMFLLVKIDPFVHCSLIDFGGLPSYLLADDSFDILNLENKSFKQAFQKYLDKLLPILSGFQSFNKGPIIGFILQNYHNSVESNVLTSFYNEKYVKFIRNQFEANNIAEILLITEKICTTMQKMYICDDKMVFYKPLERKMDQTFDSVQFKRSNCFLNLKSRYWNSDEKHKDTFGGNQVNFINLKNYMQTYSFSIRNLKCVTNFGFSTARHQDVFTKKHLYLSTSLTNSSNKCFIDERGYLTDLYWDTFGLLNKNKINKIKTTKSTYLKVDQINQEKMVRLNSTHILPFQKIIDLNPPLHFDIKSEAIFMEYINFNFKQTTLNYGFVLYRLLNINQKKGSTFFINTDLIKDDAILVCDFDKHVFRLDNTNKNKTFMIKLDFDCDTLFILVENNGRSSDLAENFKEERKGVLSKNAFAFKNRISSSINWKVNIFDFNPILLSRLAFNSNWIEWENKALNGPFMAHFSFNAQKLSSNNLDSNLLYDNFLFDKVGFYLFMKDWQKGFVFVNGFNLGKYWNIGPLLTLYIPADVLRDGKNEILVFELYEAKKASIFLSKTHIEY